MRKALTLLILLLSLDSCAANANFSWSLSLGDSVTVMDYSRGVYYIATSNKVHAVDATGLEIWNEHMGDTIQALKSSRHGIAVCTSDGVFTLLDESGIVRARIQTPSVSSYPDAIGVYPPNVFLGSNNGQAFLYSLNGTQIFNFTAGGYIVAVGRAPMGYMVSSDRALYLLDESGALLDETEYDGFVRAFSFNRGSVALASNRGVLWLYNESLSERWGYGIGNTVGVVDVSESYVASGDRAGRVSLFHMNGSMMLQHNASAGIVSIDLSDDMFAAGSLDGKVEVIGLSDPVKKAFRVDGIPRSLILENGSLAVATNNGNILYHRFESGVRSDADLFILSIVFFIFLSFFIMLRSW